MSAYDAPRETAAKDEAIAAVRSALATHGGYRALVWKRALNICKAAGLDLVVVRAEIERAGQTLH
jgi:phage-related protein